jgi:hypothetical protein
MFLRSYPRVSALNVESQQIYNCRLSAARRVVEHAFSILTQKCRLFYGRIQLSPENVDKVVVVACVLHIYLRYDVSVEDCVIENTDAPSPFSYITTFRRSGGSASEEAMSIREKCRQYFQNIGPVPWQLKAIRRGRAVQK